MASTGGFYQGTNWINGDSGWAAFGADLAVPDADWAALDAAWASLNSSTDNSGALDEIQYTIPNISNSTTTNIHQALEKNLSEEDLLRNLLLQHDQDVLPDPTFLHYGVSHETQGNDHQCNGLTIDPRLLLPDRPERITNISRPLPASTSGFPHHQQQSHITMPQISRPVASERPLPAVAPGPPRNHHQGPVTLPQGSKPTGVLKRGAPKRRGKGDRTTPLAKASHQQHGFRKVQSHACDNCRRSKQSCGGDGTNPCERCQEKGRTCVFSHIDNRTLNSTLASLSRKHNQLLQESCELLTVLNLVRPRFRKTKSGETAAAMWSARKPPASIFDALVLFDEDVLHRVTMPCFAELDAVMHDACNRDLPAARRALEKIDREGVALFNSIRDIIEKAIAANRQSYSNTMEIFIHDFLHATCKIGQTRAYLNSLVPDREPLAKLAAAESAQRQQCPAANTHGVSDKDLQ